LSATESTDVFYWHYNVMRLTVSEFISEWFWCKNCKTV